MNDFDVFKGRPIKFEDRDVRAPDLQVAMINLKHAAQEAFGDKNIDDVIVDGFENKHGMNVRALIVKFAVASEVVKRRKFIDKWMMPTTKEQGDVHLSNVLIDFRFSEPKGMG